MESTPWVCSELSCFCHNIMLITYYISILFVTIIGFLIIRQIKWAGLVKVNFMQLPYHILQEHCADALICNGS